MTSLLKRNTKTRNLILIAALLVVLIILPLVVTQQYVQHIFIYTFYIACGSMAWSILSSMTGQFSMGHALYIGLGAFTVTVLQIQLGWSPWISVLIAMVVYGLLAMLVFYPCFCLTGPYFTLATIAIAEMIRNIALGMPLLNKASGLTVPFGEDNFALIRFVTDKTPYYYIALGMLLLITAIVFIIDKSKLGYAFKTVREDEGTANAVGINPLKYKLISVFISVALTVLCGMFYAVYFRFVDPDVMLQQYSVEFVLPAIVGGIGFAGGPLLGAAILIPLSEILRAQFGGVISGINVVIYSLVMILIIRFQPKGIIGWYQDRRIMKRRVAALAENGASHIGNYQTETPKDDKDDIDSE